MFFVTNAKNIYLQYLEKKPLEARDLCVDSKDSQLLMNQIHPFKAPGALQ